MPLYLFSFCVIVFYNLLWMLNGWDEYVSIYNFRESRDCGFPLLPYGVIAYNLLGIGALVAFFLTL
jgi:hypothetical protein